MTIKSFRGLIADGAIDTITLHTNTGSKGYRIKKFELMANEPGQVAGYHTIKIYTIPQTTTSVNNEIDFSDNTLLGAAYLTADTNPAYPPGNVIIFDNMTFNQDIYVTHVDTSGSGPCNYYIELEMIKLDLNENTVATLKDIRNIEAQRFSSTP